MSLTPNMKKEKNCPGFTTNKSRSLEQYTSNAVDSDTDELALEQDVAGHSYSDEDEEESEGERKEDDRNNFKPSLAGKDTSSIKPKGRPKGYRKPRTPTPPPHLPSFYHYFFQNRRKETETSSHTISSLTLISHEDYHKFIDSIHDNHALEKDFLHSLHARSFDQWIFELSQGYSVCIYGWGSKHNLLNAFAERFSRKCSSYQIVVVNGYNAALTTRLLLDTLASAISSTLAPKTTTHHSDPLAYVLRALSSSSSIKILLVVNSIDGPSLRRPALQSLLSRLASLPHFSLISSADNPQFPLLWGHGLLTQFNWVFHDCTTFESYDVEVSRGYQSSVVDEVNALLGRSGRKLQGREGVMYVLRSLTANARNLYALLINELLSTTTNENGDDLEPAQLDDNAGDEDFLAQDQHMVGDPSTSRSTPINALKFAVPTHLLYTRAVAQLITTNEVNYRALLKEFYDHEMLISRRDAFGSEVLGVPFRREEMEIILTDLIGGA